MTNLPLYFKWRDTPQTLSAGGYFCRPPASRFVDLNTQLHHRICKEIRLGEPWQQVVDRELCQSRPWLHRIITDDNRSRFFREVRPLRQFKILDVGSGWGQQALHLATNGNFVCAVEPNPDRMDFIRAVARQLGHENRLWFIESNMQEIAFDAVFDAVTCIGVFEWAGVFDDSSDPLAAQLVFLSRLRRALIPGGECIIGIENRLGLKYLLGVRDDHTGVPRISVFDYSLANTRFQAIGRGRLTAVTHTAAEYRIMLQRVGFSRVEFFCAFPDYKVPEMILRADDTETVNRYFLDGGYCPEHDGFDGSPLPDELQAELRSHYRSLAALGIAQFFSPSFFIIAS